MNSYIPGKGFKDGWNDRKEGKPNRWVIEMGSATTDDPYWGEYKHGYGEADVDILTNARRNVREEDQKKENSRFLAE
jgi:hypothetical protein